MTSAEFHEAAEFGRCATCRNLKGRCVCGNRRAPFTQDEVARMAAAPYDQPMSDEHGVHPCNLRSTTPAQREAIEQTEQNFSTDGQVTLRATVAGWDGYDGDDLAVQFIYSYNDDPDGSTGLEVTVFDAEGNVTDSQDFG